MWILPMLIDWVRSKYIKLKDKKMKKFDKFHHMTCWQFFGKNWTPRGSKNIIGDSKQQRTVNLHPDAGEDEGRRRGDDRGWDGWVAAPTRGTWVWTSSGSWWWTGKTAVMRSMRSQRVGHNWVAEMNQTEIYTSDI